MPEAPEQPRPFAVTTRTEESITIVEVSGELDAATAPELRSVLAPVSADRGRSLIVDLRGCSFIDSTGLAAIMHGTRPLQNGESNVALVCGEGSVRRLLSLTAVDQTLRTFEALDAAVEAIRAES
jgi:anti-sigma B factor antagonist